MSDNQSSRRDFLKASAVAGGALAANYTLLGNVHAQGNESVRVGLVGCGGRGSGAAADCLHAHRSVRLVAMGDAFRDRIGGARDGLRREFGDRVDVPDDRMFVGLDAHQRVIANCDLVILATPPGFRPTHLAAAIEARKHIFTEKPVAVDGPGAKRCLELYETARERNLCIVAGTQRRYQTSYLQVMERIHRGDIGPIVAARCYWNQGSLWHRARTEQMSDVEWQIRNWLYFTWLSGDHMVEQHVHNLDVMNWALGTNQENARPVSCVGLGGRQVRTGAEFGHIFDHFACDYTYPNNVHVLSMCRQQEGTAGNVSEALVGARGNWVSAGQRMTNAAGEVVFSFQGRNDNQPYRAEHVALIDAIRNGRPINDLKKIAESTLTAIMGRMACYTGQQVTWDQALNSRQNLMPENLTMDTRLQVPPVAMPGRTELV